MEQYIEFASNHIILVASFFMVLGMLIFTEINRATRGFKDISPIEATRLLNHENTLMLDIRPIGERKDGAIINDKHIPTGELLDRLPELEKYKSAHVIPYCRSGNRSVAACSILKKNGFESVHNLGGGILAWQSANLPVTKH